MFWGCSLVGGKKYTKLIESSCHLSMACLEPKGPSYANKQVSLVVEENGKEFILCMLEYGKIMQVSLDLKFSNEQDITFFVNGEGTVHLTGYKLEEDNFSLYDNLEDNDLEESVSESEAVLGSSRLLELDNSDDEDSEDYVPENAEKLTATDKKSKISLRKKIPDSASKADKSDTDDNNDDDEEESDDNDDDDADIEDDPKTEEDGLEAKERDLETEDDEHEAEEDDLEDEEEEEEEDDEEEDESSEEEVPTTNGKRKVQPAKGNESKRAKTDVATPAKTQKQKQIGGNIFQKMDTNDSDLMESSIGRTPMPAKRTESFQNIKPMLVTDDSALSNSDKKRKNKKMKDSAKMNVINLPNEVYSKKLAGGVEATDIRVGNGPIASKPRLVHISYIGRLPDNTIFDSNTGHEKPFAFRLGSNEVIKGMDVGITGMQVGGKRKLRIPSSMGYGKKGCEDKIPPNTTLYFTVELKAVT